MSQKDALSDQWTHYHPNSQMLALFVYVPLKHVAGQAKGF